MPDTVPGSHLICKITCWPIIKVVLPAGVCVIAQFEQLLDELLLSDELLWEEELVSDELLLENELLVLDELLLSDDELLTGELLLLSMDELLLSELLLEIELLLDELLFSDDELLLSGSLLEDEVMVDELLVKLDELPSSAGVFNITVDPFVRKRKVSLGGVAKSFFRMSSGAIYRPACCCMSDCCEMNRGPRFGIDTFSQWILRGRRHLKPAVFLGRSTLDPCRFSCLIDLRQQDAAKSKTSSRALPQTENSDSS